MAVNIRPHTVLFIVWTCNRQGNFAPVKKYENTGIKSKQEELARCWGLLE
jgi:hypothetical protein